VATPRDAVALLALSQGRLGSTLTAFELVSDFALALVEKHFAARSPFAVRHPQGVLIEVSDHEDEAHAEALLESLLSDAIEEGLAIDAVVAEDIARSRALWSLRELISEAQAAEGKNVKHDVSVPISRIADFIASTDAELAAAFPGIRMVTFGHLGDGNLHYNVSPSEGEGEATFLAKQSAMNRIVHDAVAAHGGSISAEHGIGQLKREELQRYKDPAELALMHAIKRAIDPRGIMNPGKVL
jgi:FAD/FMN-containing dehydrogenase